MEQNYQSTPERPQSNGMAIASMVLGILAVIFVFIVAWVGIVLAIIGLILSIVAKKQNPSGMATAGLVLNIVALGICVIVIIACAACAASLLPFVS